MRVSRPKRLPVWVISCTTVIIQKLFWPESVISASFLFASYPSFILLSLVFPLPFQARFWIRWNLLTRDAGCWRVWPLSTIWWEDKCPKKVLIMFSPSPLLSPADETTAGTFAYRCFGPVCVCVYACPCFPTLGLHMWDVFIWYLPWI